jgi:hypothetical protein
MSLPPVEEHVVDGARRSLEGGRRQRQLLLLSIRLREQIGLEGGRARRAESLRSPAEDRDGVVRIPQQGLQPRFDEQVVGDAQAPGRCSPSRAEAFGEQPLDLAEEPVGGVAAGVEGTGQAGVQDVGEAIEGPEDVRAPEVVAARLGGRLLQVVGLVDDEGRVVAEQVPRRGLVAEQEGMVGHDQLGSGRRPARRDHVARATPPVGTGAAQAVVPGRFDGTPEFAFQGAEMQLRPVPGAGQVEPAKQLELEPDDIEVRAVGADVATAKVALKTSQADVVAAALQHRPAEGPGEVRLQRGQLPGGELLLEGDGVGGDHGPAATPLDPEGERGEVAERLPDPRPRLHEEASAALQALGHGPCHLLLGLPILVTGALGERASGPDQAHGGVGQGPGEERLALAAGGVLGAGGGGGRRFRSWTRQRGQALAARVGSGLHLGVLPPLGRSEVEEVPERRPGLAGDPVHLREGRPS